MGNVTYVLEKGSAKLNEDAVSLNGSVYGVFDGATSLHKQNLGKGLTGGFLASNAAKDVFLNRKGPLTALANEANEAIFRKMVAHNIDTSDKNKLWSTSAAVIKIEEKTLNWVQIGDSLILIIYKDGSYKLPATHHDHDFETLSMWEKIAHKTDKTIMEALGDQIKKVRKGMNVEYGVLNGEKEFSSFLQSGSENLENISRVLLFTDGLFIPSEHPSQNNFDIMVDLVNKGGLNEVRDYVRSIEKTDPECRKYPRFKTHDDIAAISLEFNENL